jgi:opacity protein-like surface antigen
MPIMMKNILAVAIIVLALASPALAATNQWIGDPNGFWTNGASTWGTLKFTNWGNL